MHVIFVPIILGSAIMFLSHQTDLSGGFLQRMIDSDTCFRGSHANKSLTRNRLHVAHFSCPEYSPLFVVNAGLVVALIYALYYMILDPMAGVRAKEEVAPSVNELSLFSLPLLTALCISCDSCADCRCVLGDVHVGVWQLLPTDLPTTRVGHFPLRAGRFLGTSNPSPQVHRRSLSCPSRQPCPSLPPRSLLCLPRGTLQARISP